MTIANRLRSQAGCFAILALLCFPVVARAQQTPNIVVFIADDLGWEDTSPYGNRVVRTPNLQRLADEGIRFDNFFLTASSCSPSRNSMLSARYPHNTTAMNLHEDMSPSVELFPEVLREAGYHTMLVGKSHGTNDKQVQAKFDVLEKADWGKPWTMGDRWLAQLRARPKARPFFLWAASIDPHRPYNQGKYEINHNPADVIVPPYYPDIPEVRAELAQYYDEISRFDQHVGMVLDQLEDEGELDNTLILVLSDNGKPFPQCKTRVNVQGLKSPLIVRYPPRVKAGSVSPSLVSAVDLAPTILEIAGSRRMKESAGKSFVPALENPQALIREFAFAEHNWHSFRAFERAAITADYVYIKNELPELSATPPGDVTRVPSNVAMQAMFRDGKLASEYSDSFISPRQVEELFAIGADVHCMSNIAADADSQTKLTEMRGALAKWQAETGDKFPGADALKPDIADRTTGEKVDQPQSKATRSGAAPNVIVVLADDLGFSDLGCYGSEIPTPNLDSLASHGAKFSAFYTSARCCPSRASLMTGLHPHQAGIGSFANREPQQGWGPAYTGHLLPTCVTLAETLGDADYSTWMVGKWHMGEPGPIERGFQNYFGYQNFLSYAESQWDASKYVRLPARTKAELSPTGSFYATDVFTDYALEFMRQGRSAGKPYFLYLAHSSPHFPLQAPKQSIDRHVETYRAGWDTLRQQRFVKQKTIGLMPESTLLPPRSKVPVDDPKITSGYGGKPNPAWQELDSSQREDLARRGATFAAMVEHVDQGVGKIIEDLKANNELNNTLIVFLSDNGACYEWGPFGFDGPSRHGLTKLHIGEMLDNFGQADTHSSYGSGWASLGNTPLNMYKHFCHEGGISSPLIVHWPEQIKSTQDWIRTPTHLMDVLPTILDAAGVSYPTQRGGYDVTPVAGQSLLPMIEGIDTAPRALAFEHQAARGLRSGNWKLTWGKRQSSEPTWELYDLETDRSEQHNLAAEYPAIVKDLTDQWESWAKQVGAEPFQKSDDPDSPNIQNVPLRIEAEIEGEKPVGVVLAQGGRQHGYALHFVDGKPAFDVRVNGQVTRLMGDKSVSGRVQIVATFDASQISLQVTGEPSLTTISPGLIPVQPQDKLSIGLDERSAAGNYKEPNRFSGKVLRYDVKAIEPATTKN